MKKVVHVMRRFSLQKWGGTETVVYHFCKELQKHSIESVIFCTDMFSKVGRETVLGVVVRRFSYCFPWLGLSEEARQKMRLKGGSPLSLPLFFALCFEPNLSLIHVHVQHRLGGLSRFVAKWRNIPYVVSIHGGYFTLPIEHKKKMEESFTGKWEWGKAFGWFWGARRTLQDADAILCVGKDEYEKVKESFPSKRVHYLPNGVDEKRFLSIDPLIFRQKMGFSPSEKYVLCVSRIDFQKNQVLLVEAFAEFYKKNSSYYLVLIGAISVEHYRHTIEETIKRLQIEKRVILLPGYPPDSSLLASAYLGAEMFVLPSEVEPFGIVILEAWAAGVAVIASNVGGIKGFTCDRQNILLFTSNDREGLLQAMEELSMNRDLKRALIQNAKEEIKKYSWTALTTSLVKIYRSL